MISRQEPWDPRTYDVDTSRQAAVRARNNAEANFGKLFAAVKASGKEGLTCDEAMTQLDMPHATASPQWTNLKQCYWVRDSGRRRKTRRDCNAAVMVANHSKHRISREEADRRKEASRKHAGKPRYYLLDQSSDMPVMHGPYISKDQRRDAFRNLKIDNDLLTPDDIFLVNVDECGQAIIGHFRK